METRNTDNYARELLYEAARLLSIRCPRCARARLRRIAQHDVETTGADYEEALRKREQELKDSPLPTSLRGGGR